MSSGRPSGPRSQASRSAGATDEAANAGDITHSNPIESTSSWRQRPRGSSDVAHAGQGHGGGVGRNV